MAMTWDAPMVSALADELKPLLAGARLRGHDFRWDARELVLVFEEGTLRWHLHPRMGWVFYSGSQGMPDGARPLSCRVVDVQAHADERTLELRLLRKRGKTRAYRIVVELMTNQWNALLLEGESDRIRHLLWTRRLEERTLAIGQRYVPPPPSTRRGIKGPLSGEEWAGFLEGKDKPEARRTLLDQVAFTSPINIESLLGPDPNPDPALVQQRWESLRTATQADPCVLEFNGDNQPYHILLHDVKAIHFPSFMAAIEAAAGKADGSVEPDLEVLEWLERALHRARGRVKGLGKEMAAAADPGEPRAAANLLLARLGDVPRGADSAVLAGFEGEEVRIHLDPAKSAQENAQALYEEAARRERVLEKLPDLLGRAERAVESLEGLLRELAEGTLTPEEAAARFPGARKTAPPGHRQEPRLPYRSYLSSGGLEIRVGRGSKDNDALTFRHAHPEDVWLHARGRSGAHVVLHWRREGNPPRRDLMEAATLAALNSGARTSGVVPVDWTRRKHVRKPRRSPPGTVVPDRVQTIFVEPDPELPERLSRGAGEGSP